VAQKPPDSPGTLFLKKTPRRQVLPTAAGDACLILLYPAGPNIGRRTPLGGTEYVLGRVTEADIVMDRDSVSRRHARLIREQEGEWFVEDLGSTNGTFVNDVRITRSRLKDGDQIRIGEAIYKFLAGTNVEAAYHEEIYRMTILDGLTGIHNKRYFVEFLERELARSTRHGHPLTLVMLDIDHFKSINDERGHLCGDAALKELTHRIAPRMRREDLLARYGGEEFAAILTVTPLAGGVRFAEDIRKRIEREPFVFDGESFGVTISLGVASIEGGPTTTDTGNREDSGQDLIRRADAKLYEAKRGGRNRVEA
jgi:diguanylate cyclase (GGDEF)-like protein